MKGGHLAALGSDSKLRDTPAAPEPMASHLRFYEDEELASLADKAGFAEVKSVFLKSNLCSLPAPRPS